MPFYPIIFLVVIPMIVDVVYHEFTRTQAPREQKSTKFKLFTRQFKVFIFFVTKRTSFSCHYNEINVFWTKMNTTFKKMKTVLWTETPTVNFDHKKKMN